MDERLEQPGQAEFMEQGRPVESIRADEPPEIAGSSSTRINYTLNFTGWPTVPQIVAVAVAAAVYTVLSWLTLITFPATYAGVSSVFLAIGFGIAFSLWFGGWSFVIAYIGNFVGAGLMTGMPILAAIPFGAADLIQLGLPVVLYRLLAPRFGVSPIGKDVYTVKGFIFFLLCAVLPNNIIGGLYGNYILVQLAGAPANLFFVSWFTWVLSNVIVTIVIGSVLLYTLGPIVERFGLTIRDAFR
ncbi:MAG: hypothetical protein NVS2B12_29240 [Ktedonobacteraceae bacterium]